MPSKGKAKITVSVDKKFQRDFKNQLRKIERLEKKKIEELKRGNDMFRQLPTGASALLTEILENKNHNNWYNGEAIWKELSYEEQSRKRHYLSILKDEGYVQVYVHDSCHVLPKAYTYFEMEADYMANQNTHDRGSTTTNVFQGDAKNIQIQQGTSNSSQSMSITENVDFEKALEIFNHVLASLGTFDLSNEDREQLEKTASEAKPKAEAKNDGSFVSKSLWVVRDIMLRASGSLTAQGILFGLQQMGVM